MNLVFAHQQGKVELEQVWRNLWTLNAIRKRVKMLQDSRGPTEFSKRALQEWEQGGRQPEKRRSRWLYAALWPTNKGSPESAQLARLRGLFALVSDPSNRHALGPCNKQQYTRVASAHPLGECRLDSGCVIACSSKMRRGAARSFFGRNSNCSQTPFRATNWELVSKYRAPSHSATSTISKWRNRRWRASEHAFP